MVRCVDNLVVSQAGIAHASVLARLHAMCFASAWSSHAFCELLNMPGTFGLLATEHVEDTGTHDALSGFALVTCLHETAEILTIGVVPERRRKGAGMIILNEIHAVCATKGAARIVLEVNKTDLAAASFYANAGYGKIGVRYGYYKRLDRSRDDALVLSRMLEKC